MYRFSIFHLCDRAPGDEQVEKKSHKIWPCVAEILHAKICDLPVITCKTLTLTLNISFPDKAQLLEKDWPHPGPETWHRYSLDCFTQFYCM